MDKEKQGLLDGLSGIAEVDMIEINKESSLRYVASRYQNRKFIGDGFQSSVEQRMCWTVERLYAGFTEQRMQYNPTANIIKANGASLHHL